MNKTLLGAAFAAAMMVGGAASAMTCDDGKSEFTLEVSLLAQCESGNDSVSDIDRLFPDTPWTLADKNDDNNSGDGAYTIADPLANGDPSGDWEIGGFDSSKEYVFVLKASSGFGAFLVNVASGTWDITKLKDGNGRALSHASLYYRDGDGGGVLPPPVVPVPASLPLLLTGLVGAGVVARRRRK